VFGVQRFHDYLVGHHFLLYTDHKPLLALLNEHHATSPQSIARIRRWSLFLSVYARNLKIIDTLSHASADALSRRPLAVVPSETETPPEVILLMEHLCNSQIIQLMTSMLQRGRTPSCQRSFSMSVEVGLTTIRVEQICPLFSHGELNSLCKMDVYSGDLVW